MTTDPANLQPPEPKVARVNQKPLLVAGLVLLFLAFFALGVIPGRNKPTSSSATAQALQPADQHVLSAFLEEQRQKADRPRIQAPPSRPLSQQATPSWASPPNQPGHDDSDLPTPPGVYNPHGIAAGAAPAFRPPSSPAPAAAVPVLPVLRFKDGVAVEPSATPASASDQLAALVPKLEAAALTSLSATPGATTTPLASVAPAPAPPNGTDRARSFLGDLQKNGLSRPLELHPASPPSTPFVLHQGSLIAATLETSISSELPGQITALVRRDVYDSLTGRYLLVPQGSRLVGQYNSEVVFGASRLLVAWTRLMLPNGVSYDLQGMPGTDALGAAGLSGRVDNHWLQLASSALLLSGISAAAQLSQAPSTAVARAPSASEIAAGALGQELNHVTSSVISRQLTVAPTIRVPPGVPFNVAVTRDIVFERPYSGRS